MWCLCRGKTEARFQQPGLITKLAKPDTSQTVHLIHNFSSELKKKSDARHELLETGKTGRKKENGT